MPLSAFCQPLWEIIVLSDHSLISLLFSLVKEYLFVMNLEILILHFENKYCFDASLKRIALEFFQFLGFFLGKVITCSCSTILSLVKVCHEWPSVSYGSLKWRAREKTWGFVLEKFISLWTLILSAWIIMSSLFSML